MNEYDFYIREPRENINEQKPRAVRKYLNNNMLIDDEEDERNFNWL